MVMLSAKTSERLNQYVGKDGYIMQSETVLSVVLHVSLKTLHEYLVQNNIKFYYQYVYEYLFSKPIKDNGTLTKCRFYYMDKYRLSAKEFNQLIKEYGLKFDFGNLNNNQKIDMYIKDGLLRTEIETIHKDTGISLGAIKRYIGNKSIPAYSSYSYMDKCIGEYVLDGTFIKKTSQICSELILAKSQILKYAKRNGVQLKSKTEYEDVGLERIVAQYINPQGIFMADIEKVANEHGVHYLFLRKYLIENQIKTAAKLISELNKKYKPYLKESLLGSYKGKEEKVQLLTGFPFDIVKKEVQLYCEAYTTLDNRSSINEKIMPFVNEDIKTLKYSYSEIARRIGVQYRTVARWAKINGYTNNSRSRKKKE